VTGPVFVHSIRIYGPVAAHDGFQLCYSSCSRIHFYGPISLLDSPFRPLLACFRIWRHVSFLYACDFDVLQRHSQSFWWLRSSCRLLGEAAVFPFSRPHGLIIWLCSSLFFFSLGPLGPPISSSHITYLHGIWVD